MSSSTRSALAIIVAALLGWEIAVRMTHTPVYILPAPTRILATLGANPALYARAAAVTLGEALGGLLLGTLAGAGAAALLSLWPRLEGGVMTLAILVKSTPLVAIAPLLTIWLGFGTLPKVIITALLTFFPVLVNALSGLQSPPPALLETLHSWHASRAEIFWHVRAPHAAPYLFAALKVSGPLSLIGAVVAEWTGASGGLGRTMWLAYTNLNLPYLFAAIFILAAAGMAFYGAIVYAEKRIVFWVA
ncbi:MAG: ABC transporter permease subunit [Anaerolineae bacterium]|nr:MAG: ABC transporter permease subunit [Anaerolineae bacterium]